MHLVRTDRLGLPQRSRDAFVLLERAGRLSADLSCRLQAMVGFRNIAVHQYQELQIPILCAIIEHHLEDFRAFAGLLVELGVK